MTSCFRYGLFIVDIVSTIKCLHRVGGCVYFKCIVRYKHDSCTGFVFQCKPAYIGTMIVFLRTKVWFVHFVYIEIVFSDKSTGFAVTIVLPRSSSIISQLLIVYRDLHTQTNSRNHCNFRLFGNKLIIYPDNTIIEYSISNVPCSVYLRIIIIARYNRVSNLTFTPVTISGNSVRVAFTVESAFSCYLEIFSLRSGFADVSPHFKLFR